MGDSLSSDAEVSRATSSHPAEAPVADSTTTKLRNSCQTCALSKVKCHKQKPTCYRCAKRCIKCEYFITKRPGRKRDRNKTTSESNSNATIVVDTTVQEGDNSAWIGSTTPSLTYDTTSGSNGSLNSAMDLDQPSPRLSNISGIEYSFSLDSFANLLMPLEDSLTNDFGDFLTSPQYFLEWEEPFPKESIPARNDMARRVTLDNSNHTAFEDFSTENTISSKQLPTLTNSEASSTSGMSLSDISDSTCHCLTQVLDLMKKLASSDLALSNTTGVGVTHFTTKDNDGKSSAQIVVEENKQIIEIITNTLECSCAEDGFILTMLSMAVVKMLGRYGAALQKLPGPENEEGKKSSDDPPTREELQQPSNNIPEVEISWRMAAQSILSELHLAQQLVNKLSHTLKTYASKRDSKCGFVLGESSRGKNRETPSGPSFSAVTLETMEIDIRKCLNTLSKEIIRILRES